MRSSCVAAFLRNYFVCLLIGLLGAQPVFASAAGMQGVATGNDDAHACMGDVPDAHTGNHEQHAQADHQSSGHDHQECLDADCFGCLGAVIGGVGFSVVSFSFSGTHQKLQFVLVFAPVPQSETLYRPPILI
jgi:hypothetical protein